MNDTERTLPLGQIRTIIKDFNISLPTQKQSIDNLHDIITTTEKYAGEITNTAFNDVTVMDDINNPCLSMQDILNACEDNERNRNIPYMETVLFKNTDYTTIICIAIQKINKKTQANFVLSIFKKIRAIFKA